MAEPGKLIDADALMKQVHSMEIVGRSFTIETTINSLCNWINSQPDASEPLRARIAELEAELVTLHEEMLDGYRYKDGLWNAAKDELRSANHAFAKLLGNDYPCSWQINWQTTARIVLGLPADADCPTINLALLLRDQGGQDD